jgi:MinD superfamily P-loop ATPase
MKIAIASGKGGTGKTTLAVALAQAAGKAVHLLDCDVEAPNANLFLKGAFVRQRLVTMPVPVVDETKCVGCGACSSFCAFQALVVLGARPVVSYDLCHGCGGCKRVCPQKAIYETPHRLGTVETFSAGSITITQGTLDIGAALATPLIRDLKKGAVDDLIVIDAPPGTSCPVVAALKEVDFVLLVTEPTPFGLNDLRLAVDVVRALGLPFGVVVNRAHEADAFVQPYLTQQRIALLATIPDDPRIARAYAEGIPLLDALPAYKAVFSGLLHKIREAT